MFVIIEEETKLSKNAVKLKVAEKEKNTAAAMITSGKETTTEEKKPKGLLHIQCFRCKEYSPYFNNKRLSHASKKCKTRVCGKHYMDGS